MSTEQGGPGTGSEGSEASGKSGASPLGILMPADAFVWNECRKLVSDKNIRVEDLATCASQDPIIVLDLIRVSNAMFFAGGKSPITSTKTSIVRLGSDTIIELLEKIKERPRLTHDDVSHWFELHRSRCRRTAIIARVLAEALTRTLADDCQTAGLLLFTGDLLAVCHFGEKYVALAEEHSRSGLNFRLVQDHKFDPERMGLSYLRRYGIPEALLFALDREARSRSQERAIMKPLCMAAGELVDAFDSNRWEKLAPGKSIPPKSSLRMLQIPDNQYLKIYERCSEYLFSARLLEEKRKLQASADIDAIVMNAEIPAADPPAAGGDDLESDIQNLLAGLDAAQSSAAEPAVEFEEEGPEEFEEAPATLQKTPPLTGGFGKKAQKDPSATTDQFDLEAAKKRAPRAARAATTSTPAAQPPVSAGKKGAQVISSLNSMMESAQNGQELLAQLLDMLVKSGTFEKTALIVVSKDRKKAVVVAARGPNIGNGQTLVLDDPLSPLAQCFSKVQSFGNRENKSSPWGSRAFALAPVDADHDTPVALYADCGTKGSVTFEARRIFRTVVELLNKKLPEIPGGIPVEI